MNPQQSGPMMGPPPQGQNNGYGSYGPPQQQQPMMGPPMMQAPPVQGAPPRPQKQPMDPKTKKKIILFSCIGGGVLVLGVAAAIVIPIALKINYTEIYEVAKPVDDERTVIEGYEGCSGVFSDVKNSYITLNDYEERVSKCKGAMEGFEKGVVNLSKMSGMSRDSELKRKWESFEVVYDKVWPAYGKYIGYASEWHRYVAGWAELTKSNDWWKTANDEKIANAVAPIVESDNKDFSEYGKGFVDVWQRYIKAFQEAEAAEDAYMDALRNSGLGAVVEPKKAYEAATVKRNGLRAEKDKYIRGEPDVKNTETIVGLDINAAENKFLVKFGEVYTSIRERYVLETLSN